MTAMQWTRMPTHAPRCTNGCGTDRNGPAVGMWRLTLIDRPAGAFCVPCYRAMLEAWKSALEPDREQEAS